VRLVYTQISPGHIWTTLHFQHFQKWRWIKNWYNNSNLPFLTLLVELRPKFCTTFHIALRLRLTLPCR
jgi:hypothetical protein